MKQLFYKLEDNEDVNLIFPCLDDVFDFIKCEMEDKEEDEEIQFAITNIWLTDEEISSIPEAD